MISTLKDFILAVDKLENISYAYELFEFETADKVRDAIYNLADAENEEPFRSAMYNMGFCNF